MNLKSRRFPLKTEVKGAVRDWLRSQLQDLLKEQRIGTSVGGSQGTSSEYDTSQKYSTHILLSTICHIYGVNLLFLILLETLQEIYFQCQL